MQLRTFVFEFPVSGGGFHKVEIHANDQFAARRLLERQYGKVEIWKTYEKKEAVTSGSSSNAGQTKEDDGEFLIVLLGAVVFSPFLAILGAPAWFVYDKLSSQDTHLGIVIAAILGTLLVTGVVLYLIFAFVPQSVLVLVGFSLYGAIGYMLGSDQTWKAIIGGGLGILGAVLTYFIGSTAKSDLNDGRTAEDHVVASEEDDDDEILEAVVPPPQPSRRAKTNRLH